MDDYTQKTRSWLDLRFRTCDDNGIYFAHQPIYGFRKGHSEPGIISRYIRTFRIMRSLAHLEFDTVLDVGGAEGYIAYIASRLFGAKVRNYDISEEACKRANEIFGIESIAGDIHSLPFSNNQFDIVLCIETLEHVKDYYKAVSELLRVADRALIITVPHESKIKINKNIEQRIPHSHIHKFNLNSFDYLKSEGYDISVGKLMSPLLTIPGVLVEAIPRPFEAGMGYHKLFFNIYNYFIPLLRKLSRENNAAFLIRIDGIVSKITFQHKASIFIIMKNKKYYKKKEHLRISPKNIINLTVPFHYLRLE
jgi:hypothetical protein